MTFHNTDSSSTVDDMGVARFPEAREWGTVPETMVNRTAGSPALSQDRPIAPKKTGHLVLPQGANGPYRDVLWVS